jgi:5'-nucleotidase
MYLFKCRRFFVLFFLWFTVSTTHPLTTAPTKSTPLRLKILGLNDFHGQITTGRFVNGEPVGGAAILASYLKGAQEEMDERTLIAISGDHVGASPPASALLHDEPTIMFTNNLGNRHCTTANRMNAYCNLVATIGNHEFDKGLPALFDLIYGSFRPPTDFWYPTPYYEGAAYPYISANIVDEASGVPIVPPYVIKIVDGVSVAFIGAILKTADTQIFPAYTQGIKFLDEATAINQYIPEIKKQGADIIVVLLHEGGSQEPYEGPTQESGQVNGIINSIVHNLKDEVDVVIGGHTHQFLNTYLPNQNGTQILVTQANSYSASFAEVTLEIDRMEHTIQQKTARIITTYAHRGAGTSPDLQAQSLVALAEEKTASIINEYLNTAAVPLLRAQNNDGESNLGNLIADGLRQELHADIGLTNIHGLRDDISAGTITKGSIYSVLPFSNTLVTVTLTGQDIYDLLEQQWMGSYDNLLQISGIRYTYKASNPIGQKITQVWLQEEPLIKERVYTIATSDFLASGSGVFSVMKRSKLVAVEGYDHEVISRYVKQSPQPISSAIDGRMQRLN